MKAFTLVEILVAVSLFLLLGLLLLTVLQDTMRVWHHTESQNQMNAAARQVFSYLREDIEAAYAGGALPAETPFLLDYDERQQQRLRFVRRMPPERTEIVRRAGSQPLSAGYQEYYHEPTNASARLRALGGLCEVAYLVVPAGQGKELWRGVQAPLGSPQSLLQDVNLTAPRIAGQGHRLCQSLLHWQIRCWSHRTSKWDDQLAPAAGGSSSCWDSTLSKLPNFFLHQKSASVSPPVLPLKLQIHLVFGGPHQVAGLLAEEVGDYETEVPLRQRRLLPAPGEGEVAVAMIADECIVYTETRPGMLAGVTRGALGTRSRKHAADTVVQAGQRFTTTIQLPVSQIPWQTANGR